MNVCGSLFSGIGLLDYGLTLAGWQHAFLCESEPDRRAILSMRWPGVPIYSDVRDVDRSAPRVDLLAGGFPCRGASTAGLREGLDHPETALWREFARIIGELRPRLVLLENVANLLAVRDGRAWAEVVGDLAAFGYVCAWDCLPAAAFGAPHLRDRVFLVACNPDGEGWPGGRESEHPESARTRVVADDLAAPDPRNGRRRSPERDLRTGQPDAEGVAPADSQRNGVQQQPESERGSGGTGEPAETGGVSWGTYAPTIARWEETHGPAPEPLIRGVDARGARKVVRSRLSALGDGVQVQAGHYLGERLLTALPQDRKETA